MEGGEEGDQGGPSLYQVLLQWQGNTFFFPGVTSPVGYSAALIMLREVMTSWRCLSVFWCLMFSSVLPEETAGVRRLHQRQVYHSQSWLQNTIKGDKVHHIQVWALADYTGIIKPSVTVLFHMYSVHINLIQTYTPFAASKYLVTLSHRPFLQVEKAHSGIRTASERRGEDPSER